MHDAVTSLVLLALTVTALIIMRGRGLLARILAEAALLLAIGAFLLWQGTSPLPHFGNVRVGLADAWFRALAVVWWLMGARLVVNMTILARGDDPKSRGARLFSDLAAAVIYITTVLIVFDSVLDLNVSALLVTSGATAIVLGLALQNTLADVFFGLAIVVEQPFHVGDRISVGESVEGVIVQMNWRSVRLRTDGDDLATIPNSVVAKGQIVNRSVPTRRRAGSVEVLAPVDATCETVFELMRQATLLCPDLLSVPAPSITIRRAGLHSCTYAVSFFVPDSPALTAAKSALLCQIRRLFQHAGIGQPGPMRPAELLESITLFEVLSPEELETLAGDLIVHSVEPGESIFVEGSVSTSIYVIAAGVMEISRQGAQSVDEVLGRIGAGEYVGELGWMTGSLRAFTVKSLTHAKVLELRGCSLADLRQRNTRLNDMMERSVHRALALLHQNDAAMVGQPAQHAPDIPQRIRAFLGI